jgi:hypothetical protein
MSNILKGRVFSKSHKLNISKNHFDVSGCNNPNWKGGINSIKKECEECKKIFNAKKSSILEGRARFCSKICHNLWMSRFQIGENASGWRGGRTNLINRLRKSSVYKLWRKLVYERDNFQCVQCGQKGIGKNLNADHKRPFSVLLKENNISDYVKALGCFPLWQVDNGQTLCVDCHKKTESYLNCNVVKQYLYA